MFVTSRNPFAMRNFKGTCSPLEMLQEPLLWHKMKPTDDCH